MIFHRALRRELVSTAGATLTTLFTITVTFMLIKILGLAAGGRIASQDVVALIGFQSLNYLPVILILTGYVSVLLVISRSYQDSEMVVWFASGIGLTQWIGPVLKFGGPLIFLTGLLAFEVTPWANRGATEYRRAFESRSDIARVSPGRFQESGSGDRVFFVEGLAEGSTKVQHVFVSTNDGNRNSIVVARQGSLLVEPDGSRFVVLEDGRRYDNQQGGAGYRIMQFERYRLAVDNSSTDSAADQSARGLPTSELIRNPSASNRGELLWRIGLPCMALLLMLLAIPLGFVNPRVGRSANLLVAVLIFAFYSNSVSFFQASVSQNRLPLGVAWWPVHVVLALVITLFFAWRIGVNSHWHPRVILGRRRAARSDRQVGLASASKED